MAWAHWGQALSQLLWELLAALECDWRAVVQARLPWPAAWGALTPLMVQALLLGQSFEELLAPAQPAKLDSHNIASLWSWHCNLL